MEFWTFDQLKQGHKVYPAWGQISAIFIGKLKSSISKKKLIRFDPMQFGNYYEGTKSIVLDRIINTFKLLIFAAVSERDEKLRK